MVGSTQGDVCSNFVQHRLGYFLPSLGTSFFNCLASGVNLEYALVLECLEQCKNLEQLLVVCFVVYFVCNHCNERSKG